MKLQYIIQIENQESYPFDGTKPKCTDIRVRTSFHPSKESYNHIQFKIHVLLNVKSSIMMHIIKITEIKGKRFEVDFQYVGQALKNSYKMNEASFLPFLKEALTQFYKELVKNNIKYQIKFQDIGITENGAIKVFLGLKFEIVSQAEQQSLEEQYQIMVQKMIESHFNYRQTVKSPSDNTFVSDYSHRVNKKLTQFQDRLNKMRKYSKQTLSSNSNGSSKNQDKNDTKNMFLDLATNKKTVRLNTVATGLTSNSFIHHKKADQVKPHKFSFADYSTSSHKLDKLDESSSKQSSLTQRINSALQKTQVAFKVYQKYSTKKSRRRK